MGLKLTDGQGCCPFTSSGFLYEQVCTAGRAKLLLGGEMDDWRSWEQMISTNVLL